jgi:hypothetical protein
MSDQTPQKNAPEGREDFKLKLAGAGYIVGDLLMLGAASARTGESQWGNLFGSVSWLAGGLGAAFFGNPKIDKQLEIHSNKLENYLKEKGITIPADARARNALLKDRNLWEKVELFLYEHPSEILNSGYLVGAVGMLINGAPKQFKEGMTILPKSGARMSSNFWMGTFVTLGALAGLFLKEDPHAKEKAKDGNIVDKTVAFATENPLRISSALYFLNNIPLLGNVMDDWKRGQGARKIHPAHLSTAQLAVYMICNTLLFMSPKEQTTKHGFTTEELGKLEDAATTIIAAQPREIQETIIKDVSEYMSKQSGVKLSPEQLGAQLKERLNPKTTLSPAERRFAERVATRELAEHAAITR